MKLACESIYTCMYFWYVLYFCCEILYENEKDIQQKSTTFPQILRNVNNISTNVGPGILKNENIYWHVCSVLYILCQLAFLRLPWVSVFRAFSSVVRQMPEYILRKDGARPALFLISELCISVYCLYCSIYCLYRFCCSTRWFKCDRDWFVCKQAALRSSYATLREWSHNLHPPSCSG